MSFFSQPFRGYLNSVWGESGLSIYSAVGYSKLTDTIMRITFSPSSQGSFHVLVGIHHTFDKSFIQGKRVRVVAQVNQAYHAIDAYVRVVSGADNPFGSTYNSLGVVGGSNVMSDVSYIVDTTGLPSDQVTLSVYITYYNYEYTQTYSFDIDLIEISDPVTYFMYYFNEMTDQPVVQGYTQDLAYGYIGFDIMLMGRYKWEGIEFNREK